jgi:hypothetical protein
MKKLAAFTLSLFLTTGIALADSPKDADPKPAKAAASAKPKAAKKAEKSDSAIAAEIEELRQAIQSQQEQLQLLKEELAKRDRQIDEAREAAAAANARAAEATTKATEAVNTNAEVKSQTVALTSTVSDLKAGSDALKTEVATAAAQAQAGEEPPAIRYKGITFTPGGFIAAETIFRTHATSGDVNTSFNSIPFPGSSQAHTTEFNFSGRQSRIALLAEGKTGSAKISGYYEADFLSAAASSNNNQSNSYSLRQRLLFAQAALDSGWTFTGGQQWSLVTETKKGLQNRTEAIPMTIDPQYQIGFGWERQYGFRVTKNVTDQVALGFSVEAPQTLLTAHGNTNNFLIGAPGLAGGLYNPGASYSFNKAPDFVIKAAYEPAWGGHYELFGVVSTFRARVFPCATASVAVPCPVDGSTAPSAVGAFNNSTTGGGLGANLRYPLLDKKLEVGAHFFGGDGVGRYSTGALADATVRPDGTISLIRGGSALGILEYHATPMLDLYSYFGTEYAFRAAYLNAAGAPVGYGSPLFDNSGCSTEIRPGGQASPGAVTGCTGDTRNLMEGTLGFWHRFYKGPQGTLQWGMQYSYFVRHTWSGNNDGSAVSLSPKSIENMVWTSFRYYIP